MARSDMDLNAATKVLRRDIFEGRFVPGQRLVESDLMQYLNTSRGRVREVFRRLESEGLVRIDKHRGASVRRVSREAVANITEVLEDISVLVIRRAAKNIGDERNRKRLKESLKVAKEFRRESDSLSQVSAYMDENFRFWGSLADVAGNPVLSEIRLRLQSQLARFAYQGVTVDGNKDMWISWHEEIIEDLLEGDAAKAVRHARKSMADVWQAILRLPDSAFGH